MKKSLSTILIIIFVILLIGLLTYASSDRPRQDAINAVNKVIENNLP